MLDFDVGKLVVIGVVALIVIGPKDLPRVLRQVGQVVGKMRRMASEFQGQFMDAMREADVENIKKEVEAAADLGKFDVAFDPVKDIKDQLTSAVEGDVTPGAVTDGHSIEAPAANVSHIGSLEIEEHATPPDRLAVEAEFPHEPAPASLEAKIEAHDLKVEPQKIEAAPSPDKHA